MAESSLRSACLDRFLRYVTFDTQSNENSETYPSTAKQLELLKHLHAELKAIGLKDATMDDHGYVFATIPATSKKANVPVIGLIAHVDTSPETSSRSCIGTTKGKTSRFPTSPNPS
jgi:tripeptide aminopeptidase